MKRRDLLKGLAVATVAAATTQRVWAEDKEPAETMVDYLFVQNSKAVSLKDGVLTMKGVTADTLYFSDRPERITGRITTKKFIDKWGDGDDSFKADPPNAVLSIFGEPAPLDIVVELQNPRLEGENLIYDVIVLDGEKVASGESSALFIDVVGRPLSPVSVAGVARRTSRRTARRVDRR